MSCNGMDNETPNNKRNTHKTKYKKTHRYFTFLHAFFISSYAFLFKLGYSGSAMKY